MSMHREVERKYEAPPDAELPDLGALPGVADVAAPERFSLEATYFDTADLDVTAAGITVRRRTGGDDAGWHLKLPAGGGARHEVRLPLGRARRTVPKPLRDALYAHVREQPMAPVVVVATERVVVRLLDSDGQVLAEFCDDTVTARTPQDDSEPVGWREWEVELGTGGSTLLDAADDLLRDTGADPSPTPSKLARALGDSYPTAPPAPRLRRKATAAAVVHARLREQVTELRARDPQVRMDAPDSVHKMRVALRRLRSALASFRPLLDREVTDPLRDEMKWVASALSGARDTEVVHERLRELVDEQPADLVIGPVRRRIDGELRADYRSARESALEALESDRYLRLLDDLDDLVDQPPWRKRARRRAQDVLPDILRRDWRRLRKRVAAADAATTSADRETALHEVRKAAKRARYAGEAVSPAFGGPARKFAKAMERVQTVLGDHHDTTVTRPLLHRLGTQAHADGENGFTYGLLHSVEARRADEAEHAYAAAWRRASRSKLRRWL